MWQVSAQLNGCEFGRGCPEVGGQGAGGGDSELAGLDLHRRQRLAVLMNLRMDQPVWCSTQRLTASAAKTMVRRASIESRR
jgi:hypothetical protein